MLGGEGRDGTAFRGGGDAVGQTAFLVPIGHRVIREEGHGALTIPKKLDECLVSFYLDCFL